MPSPAILRIEDVAPFTNTPADDIPVVHRRVVDAFHTHKTRSLEWRLKQLRSLYWSLRDAEPALVEACRLDLGKSAYETYMTEVGWVLNDILYMTKNLAKFARDEPLENIALAHMAVRPRIRKEPLGAVLVIGAYNFPIQLSLGPLVGAISAGCTAVLKPSEQSPHSARVMQAVISRALDPDAYAVVQGAVSETTALLACKWDKIFYTGSARVGTIIAKAAAETLTPVALELGGRNPAIVTRHADLRLAARRLLWAKLMNAGQVCVSQNYILVDEDVLPSFVHELEAAMHEFHPSGSQSNDDYSRIVNERSWQRLKDMLDSTKGKILLGGQTDKSSLFFAPTVVQLSSASDPLLLDESFGPLIPLLPFRNLDEAIRTANDIHATPLALYAFGKRDETDKILGQTRSGGASINDGFYHASIPTLAFGGVGDSGTGAYRGRASFDCFSHRRAVTSTPSWMEGLLSIRYPPYTSAKLKRLRGLTDTKPDFDREGRPIQSWISLLLGLGAQGKAGAALRWAVMVTIAATLAKQRQSKL